MKEYDKLVESLRRCSSVHDASCVGCLYENSSDMACDNRLMHDAADAIEKLQNTLKQCAEDYTTLLDRAEKLEQQMPKRGEWIHGREIGKEWAYDHWITYYEDWHCSNCKSVFRQEDKPKYHYCPNCGAKMDNGIERMESNET